jgi:homoserine kinase
MKSVNVYIPGTVSNVGSGFDVMGFAMGGVGEKMRVSLIDGNEIRLVDESGYNLPMVAASNTGAVALQSFRKALNITQGFEIVFETKIKPGSGLGSSASSAVGAVFGANELMGSPFTRKELIYFAMDGEEVASGSRHADNVAPAMLGSFVLIRSLNPFDVVQIPAPESLFCTVVHPQIEVKTSEARSLLPKQIPLKDAIQQWGNTAALIAGLYQSDFGLIGRSMTDLVAVPVRCRFIPNYELAVERAMAAGAIGFSISGSGPSMFAFSDSLETAQKVADAVAEVFTAQGIERQSYVGRIDPTGVKLQ